MYKAKCIILLLIGIIVLGISCKDDRQKQIESLVAEWNGRIIQIPDSMFFVRAGNDTVENFSIQADYKVFSYSDSIGCSGCKMQLFGWRSFIEEIDSIFDFHISVLLVVHPNDLDDFFYLLRKQLFDYPVCIDLEDRFNKLNKFPSDQIFQTFLLDKNNQVLCIGNPILNSHIKQLYYEIIKDGKLESDNGCLNNPVVVLEPQELQLGAFSCQEPQGSYFNIHNQGQEDIRIKEIISSCECITVEPEKERIAPGEDVRVYVSYHAEDSGKFFREIFVRFDNGQKYIVNVRGQAIE